MSGLSMRFRKWAGMIAVGSLAAVCIPYVHRLLNLRPERDPRDTADFADYLHGGVDLKDTEAWAAALAQLPPDPAFDEPAPEGMQWDFESRGESPPWMEVMRVLSGPWNPEARPVLRVYCRFLTSRAVTTALEAIRDVRNRPFAIVGTMAADDPRPSVPLPAPRAATKLLAARARLRVESDGDVAGALDDLETGLRVARACPSRTLSSYLIRDACESLVLTELAEMARQGKFRRQDAKRVDAMLADLPEHAPVWTGAIEGERRFIRHYVAFCFSRDRDGNGRLVVADQPSVAAYAATATISAAGRSRLWNLLAPLYADRREIEGRIDRFYGRVASAADLHYAQASARLGALDAQRLYRPSDGVFLQYLERVGLASSPNATAYGRGVGGVARRRAVRIMSALSAYRTDSNHFPDRLAQLVPEYIAVLPDDPFCDGEFGYRLEAAGEYTLYSCGTDGDDDGGVADVNRRGNPRQEDHFYTLGRRDGEVEPALLPLEAQTIPPEESQEAP